MKKLLPLLIILHCTGVLAQTTINGGAVKGKWLKQNSPYQITASINIDKGDTLIIEPGVRVEFNAKVGVYVRGHLEAIGAAGDSIEFTVKPIANYHQEWETNRYGWRGFGFFGDEHTDTSIFSHCKFSYVNKEDTTGCKFLGAGSYESDSTSFVVKGKGISCFGQRFLTVTNSKFYNCKGGGAVAHIFRGGIIFNNNTVNNVFHINDYAIAVRDASGVYIKDDIYRGKPAFPYENEISNNLFNDISGAIFVLEPKKMVFVNNNRVHRVYRYTIGARRLQGGPTLLTIAILTGNCKVDGLHCSDIIDSTNYNYSEQLFSIFGNDVTIKNISFDNTKIYSVQSAISTKLYSLIKLFRGFNTGYKSYMNGIHIHDYDFIHSDSFKFPKRSSAIFIDNLSTLIIDNLSITNSFDGISVVGKCEVKNALIANCKGSAIGVGEGDFRGTNMTIVNNMGYALGTGSGIGGVKARAYISNSIISGNIGDSSIASPSQVSYDDQSFITFKNCIVDGGLDNFDFESSFGYTNYKIDTIDVITAAPQFVSSTAGPGKAFDASQADWRLKSTCSGTSSGYNAGTTELANNFAVFQSGFELPKTDLAGNPRTRCGKVDIGAYELVEYKEGVVPAKLVDTLYHCNGDDYKPELSTELCTAPNSTFQWYKKHKDSASYRLIAGATGQAYTFPKGELENNYQYQLKVVNNECIDSAFSNPSLAIINQSPIINLGKDTSLIDNQSITLQAAGSFSQYLWNDSSTNASLLVNNDTNNLGVQNFWLEVKANNGCSTRDSIEITFKKSSSVFNLLKSDFKLYPNPNNGVFHLYVPSDGVISIYNTQGQKLKQKSLEKGEWTFDASELSKGTYIVHFKSKGNAQTHKIMIH